MVGPPATAAPSTNGPATLRSQEASTGDRPTTTVQVANPVGVRIPAIGVDADIVPLGLLPDGSIDVPSDFDQTGWWVDGPEPGEPGPAVILGHVDSRRGPAVFFDVGNLEPGDVVNVDRADGTVASFVVDRVEQHPKNDFPTDAVYGPTPDPVLRLVTCGGVFNRDRRSYEDNIIVFADFDGTAPRA